MGKGEAGKQARNTFLTLGQKKYTQYHSMKGKEEDDECKSKTIQNRTHSQPSHMVNPTVFDRHGQVAAAHSTESQSVPVTGKGSQENDVMPMNACNDCDLLVSELLTGGSYQFD